MQAKQFVSVLTTTESKQNRNQDEDLAQVKFIYPLFPQMAKAVVDA